MRSNYNQETIIGRLYQHNLQIKKVENSASPNFGKTFINGTIDVATDEEMLNIITVHYTYVTEQTKNGSTHPTFNILKRIIEEGKTIVLDGKDKAWKLRCTPAIALNDFYPQGKEDLVSQPRHEGGFVSLVTELPEEKKRNLFKTDAFITSTTRSEDDSYLSVKGAIFNFKNDILPFTFVMRNPEGIKYLESLNIDPSNPLYTMVWGHIESTTVSMNTVTESAFGEPAVDTVERKVKEWVITGMNTEPYDFGDPSVMTVEDVKAASQNRNVMLAETKKRSEEYYNSKKTSGGAPNMPIPTGGFNF